MRPQRPTVVPRVGDKIRWMRRTAVVEVVEVKDGFVTTRGKSGVSGLQAPVRSVRCVVEAG